jgi:hypothetical protein
LFSYNGFIANAFNIVTDLTHAIHLNPPFSKGEIALFPSLEKRGQGRFKTQINAFVLGNPNEIIIVTFLRKPPHLGPLPRWGEDANLPRPLRERAGVRG